MLKITQINPPLDQKLQLLLFSLIFVLQLLDIFLFSGMVSAECPSQLFINYWLKPLILHQMQLFLILLKYYMHIEKFI